jgi:hypothetical protein
MIHPIMPGRSSNKGKRDTRVQLASDEPVVQQVASLAARSQFAVILIASLDAEASNVNECSDGVGEEDARGEELDVIVADEGPDGEFSALGDCSCSQRKESGHV